MANRHFGKAADVWKHLVLCEVLAVERPLMYAETHAGSAAYPMIDDAERRFGVLTFIEASRTEPVLAASAYARHVRGLADATDLQPLYPGSALLAMLERGPASQYLLADTDEASAADLGRWADELGLTHRVEVLAQDGIGAVAARVLGSSSAATTLVHVDPFDPHLRSGTRSALELAADTAAAGAGLVYWYGYDTAEHRGWPLDRLASAGNRGAWCGDVLVTDADGSCDTGGNLGAATTPGTGFGVIIANAAGATMRRCTELGTALAAAYRGATLPDGRRGRLDFATLSPPP